MSKSKMLKKEMEDHFKFLSDMSIKEQTLYRTWSQINSDDWIKKNLPLIQDTKNKIWIPKKPDDYLKLEPVVLSTKSANDNLIWRILRYFTSTAPTYQTPGRSLRIIVMDRVTQTYLGCMHFVSDFMALKPRDTYIGWDTETKQNKKMINYLAMGGTIVPTQPLGFNYLGGKLMALLLVTHDIEKEWNAKYPKTPMVALTTTSLYGGFSMYNSLKYWKKLGTTEGKVNLEPDREYALKMRHWMREKYPKEFDRIDKKQPGKTSPASRPKGKVNSFCYSRLKIKPPFSQANRGVYFCELFENSKEFLKCEVDNPGKRKFDNSLESIVELWKEKYAKKRVNKLIKDGKYNKDVLFYDDIIDVDWESARDYYLEGKPLPKKDSDEPWDIFFE